MQKMLSGITPPTIACQTNLSRKKERNKHRELKNYRYTCSRIVLMVLFEMQSSATIQL